jgi:hypothetical protein
MRKVANAMESVAVVDHSVDTDRAAAFVAQLRSYAADPAHPNHAEVARLADEVHSAIPHIRYITKTELLEAHGAIIERLNHYAAERTDATIQYCVMMPSSFDALKSNMWVGLRVLRDCAGPAWGFAATLDCNQDMWALEAYLTMLHRPKTWVEARPVVVQFLFFDDVMYSGTQMTEAMDDFLDDIKAIMKRPPDAYACVPFVHKHNPASFAFIHPAILAMVEELSKDLPIAGKYITRENTQLTTLTYTQTKVPDYASFPTWLARLVNPLAPEYKAWEDEYKDDKSKRGGAFPLFHNCDNTDRSSSCMIGSYVPVLQRLQSNEGATRLRDFCSKSQQSHVVFSTRVRSPISPALVTTLADGVTTLSASRELMDDFMVSERWRVIMLSLDNVSLDRIKLFVDTVMRALAHFKTSGASLPTDMAMEKAVIWCPTPDADVFSLRLKTFYSFPGHNVQDEEAPSNLRALRKDFETRLAGFVTPIVTAMHASGMAHGRIGDPNSYRFSMSGFYQLAGATLHPASFTRATFKTDVSDAVWADAVAADLRGVEELVGAMVALSTSTKPPSHIPAEDHTYDTLSQKQSEKRMRT